MRALLAGFLALWMAAFFPVHGWSHSSPDSEATCAVCTAQSAADLPRGPALVAPAPSVCLLSRSSPAAPADRSPSGPAARAPPR